jgi:hypothetical protein
MPESCTTPGKPYAVLGAAALWLPGSRANLAFSATSQSYCCSVLLHQNPDHQLVIVTQRMTSSLLALTVKWASPDLLCHVLLCHEK